MRKRIYFIVFMAMTAFSIQALVTAGDEQICRFADHVIELPDTLECFQPLIASIPFQLLAYHIAVCKGKDVDRPRNLAKSVTVE